MLVNITRGGGGGGALIWTLLMNTINMTSFQGNTSIPVSLAYLAFPVLFVSLCIHVLWKPCVLFVSAVLFCTAVCFTSCFSPASCCYLVFLFRSFVFAGVLLEFGLSVYRPACPPTQSLSKPVTIHNNYSSPNPPALSYICILGPEYRTYSNLYEAHCRERKTHSNPNLATHFPLLLVCVWSWSDGYHERGYSQYSVDQLNMRSHIEWNYCVWLSALLVSILRPQKHCNWVEKKLID